MKTKILALIVSGISAFCLGQEPKVLEDPVNSNFLKELGLARGKSDVATTQRIADAIKPIAEGKNERDRFYGANALCFYLESTSPLEDPTPLLKVATIALTSPALKSDGLAWVRVVHLAAPAKAEALYKGIFEATGYSAQLAILEWLIWVKGGGYSASPFTKPGQTVTEASDALWESGGEPPAEAGSKRKQAERMI